MKLALPRVLYVSDVVPGPGSGGAIIAHRHLLRISEAGGIVTAVSSLDEKALAARYPGWTCAALPQRRWWWPPFDPARPAFSRVRELLSRRALAGRGIDREKADVIVTICWGPASWLAASMAQAWHRPLVAIVHDWWAECGSARDARIGERVCREANHIWAVSEEMCAALRTFGREKIAVLYPVPEERSLPFATWRDEFAKSPVVAHVGALHSYHLPYLADLAARLAMLSGRLLVVCPAANPVLTALRERTRNIEHHDFFPANRDALHWVHRKASAITVMYSEDHGTRRAAPTGFPSRFVEFAQLGLPVLLAAPAENPIRTWARRSQWTAQLEPGDAGAARRLLTALTRRTDWEQLAEETRAAAKGDFDPLALHSKFIASLQAFLPRAS